MQLTQIFTILAVAVAGVVAAPGGGPPPPKNKPPPPPPPPPTSVVQKIDCGGDSNPYCCSPNTWSEGYTCVGLIASSVNCNAITICCNNNQGAQACGASITGPITWE